MLKQTYTCYQCNLESPVVAGSGGLFVISESSCCLETWKGSPLNPWGNFWFNMPSKEELYELGKQRPYRKFIEFPIVTGSGGL